MMMTEVHQTSWSLWRGISDDDDRGSSNIMIIMVGDLWSRVDHFVRQGKWSWDLADVFLLKKTAPQVPRQPKQIKTRLRLLDSFIEKLDSENEGTTRKSKHSWFCWFTWLLLSTESYAGSKTHFLFGSSDSTSNSHDWTKRPNPHLFGEISSNGLQPLAPRKSCSMRLKVYLWRHYSAKPFDTIGGRFTQKKTLKRYTKLDQTSFFLFPSVESSPEILPCFFIFISSCRMALHCKSLLYEYARSRSGAIHWSIPKPTANASFLLSLSLIFGSFEGHYEKSQVLE